MGADLTLFKLSNGRALVVSDFPEPQIRADVFGDLDLDAVHSRQDLINLIQECPPLQTHLRLLGHEFLEEREHRLAGVPGAHLDYLRHRGSGRSTNGLELFLRALQRDPYEGWRQWIELSGDIALEGFIQTFRGWLAEPVDWGECAHFETPWNGQQAALAYFSVYAPTILNALGVLIVEEDTPGSTYAAAELHKAVDKANQVAVLLDLPCRFQRAATQGATDV